MTEKTNLFGLRGESGRARHAAWAGAAERLAGVLLGFSEMEKLYARACAETGRGSFAEAAISVMRVQCSVPGEDLKRIPAHGPLVVVANHPFGLLEPLVLLSLLGRIRPDVKLLGNFAAGRVAALGDTLIPVDPFGRKSSVFRNGRSLAKAARWLAGGGALLVFPAGEVASFSLREGAVSDPAWNTHAAGLARRTGAAVVPVYVHGRNGLAFQLAGLIHPRLRTLLLGRMFLGQRGRTVALAIGRPVPPEKAGRFKSDGDFTLFLRARTHVLKNRFGAGTAGAREDRRARKARAPRLSPIDPPVPAAVLEREVAALPESSVLARQEPFTVYLARAREIPGILREIGRLREVTFRAVGEGTGAPLDLDRFDPDYLHLFLWDARGSRIAGAYRLGPTDEILEGPGRRGIYTQTLFRFSPRFFERTGDALEMGRSFVAGDYQKQYQCLSLLWRGIGEYVSRNPRYRCLFGPVSISRDYRPFSKRLMVRFLRRNRMDRTLARFVHARSPYREGPVPGREAERIHRTVRDVEDADLLVSENELDGKGMPVLLRHYLRLNASLLSFNVDRAFSDVVDGLILVDLTKSDPRLLNRFLGREGARRFLDFHGIGAGASVPVPEAVSIPA